MDRSEYYNQLELWVVLDGGAGMSMTGSLIVYFGFK